MSTWNEPGIPTNLSYIPTPSHAGIRERLARAHQYLRTVHLERPSTGDRVECIWARNLAHYLHLPVRHWAVRAVWRYARVQGISARTLCEAGRLEAVRLAREVDE